MAVLKYKNGEGQFVTLTNYTVQPIVPSQTTGTSTTDVMSQKAVTDALETKVNNDDLNGKIATAITTNQEVISAITSVIGENPNVSSAVENIVSGEIAAYDSVAEGKFAEKDHNHDGIYAPASHTHYTSDINNFSDEVANAVKTEITNNNSAITESIENVIEKYIYGDDAPSADAEVVTTDNMDDIFSAYTKSASLAIVATSGDYNDLINKPTIPTTVAELSDASDYAKVDAINGLVASAISESDAVKDAIASAITSDSGITEAIEAAVEDQINAATSGKMDTDAFEAYSGAVDTILGGKADTSAVTIAIEEATSGKVDTDAFNTYSGNVENALGAKYGAVAYDSNSKRINFYATSTEGTVLSYVDATDFIKDGMVSGVTIEDGKLVITFNTDAGHEDIEIPLTSIFNPNNYYTKEQADSTFLTIASAETIYVKDDDLDDKVKEAISTNSGVSASVVSTIENYISGSTSNIYTKQEIEDNFQKKGDYVSATTFNDYTSTTVPNLLNGKADAEHTHKASAITDFDTAVADSVSGNTDVINSITKVITSSTSVSGAVESIVNEKLEDYYTKNETDSAISSAITAASGVTPTIVGEMIESALTEATFKSSAITDFADAVSGLVATNNDVKTEIIKEVTESTIFTTLSGDVYTISGTVGTLSGDVIALSGVVSGKQDALVSGTNIKTINNESLLGSGNITIEGGETASYALSGGTANGTLRLVKDGTAQANVAVTGLGNAAFLGTGTTAGTVATGNHTHTHTAITDFNSAVSGAITSNTSVKNSVISAVTSSTAFTTLSGDVNTLKANSGTAATALSTATSAKTVTDFYVGHTTASTLTNLPSTKRLVIVTVSTSQNNVSINGGVSSLKDGYELHVIVNNNGSGAITIAATGLSNPYKLVGNDISIASGSYGEINIISDGTTLYVRGA